MSKNQYKIAICDDEEIFRNQIGDMTGKVLDEEAIDYRLCYYNDGTELLEEIGHGEKFQILLLDVVMNEMDGMTLAENIRMKDEETSIVFISSDREMVFRGYEVKAARYLAKPLKEDKLKEALLYCCKQQQVNRELLLPTEYGQHRVVLSEIQYVEAYDRGTRFVLTEETIDTKLKFSEAGSILPKDGFVQSHRAYIVNLAQVKRIRSNEFELKNGTKIPISKYRYGEVSKSFFEYIR